MLVVVAGFVVDVVVGRGTVVVVGATSVVVDVAAVMVEARVDVVVAGAIVVVTVVGGTDVDVDDGVAWSVSDALFRSSATAASSAAHDARRNETMTRTRIHLIGFPAVVSHRYRHADATGLNLEGVWRDAPGKDSGPCRALLPAIAMA